MLGAKSMVGAGVGATAGAAAAFNADANNRQLHLYEVRWIKGNANALAASMSQKLGRQVSEGEAAFWLHVAGESIIDTAMQRSAELIRGTNASEEAQLFDLSKQFLVNGTRGLGFVDESGRTSQMFGTEARGNPLQYSGFRNNTEYREYMWQVIGLNLRPDSPSAAELAIYEQRKVEDLTGRAKQLLAGGFLGAMTVGSAKAMLVYMQGRVPTATVIGHSPFYNMLARQYYLEGFEVPSNWTSLSLQEQWSMNRAYLDRFIARNADVLLATPINQIEPGSFTAMEVAYLKSKGYKLSSDGRKLERKGW